MVDNMLNVLLVHDSSFVRTTSESILRTRDLKLCSIYRLNGDVESYVPSWESVLEILAAEADIRPVPDLLLIDAKFEKDRSAPLVATAEGETGSCSVPVKFRGSGEDPRGILYGAILAARFLGQENMPMGFALYSMDLPAISVDPYAQTFYGLLAAIGEAIEFPPKQGLGFEKEMHETRAGGKPDDCWPTALKRYRSMLWRAIGRRFSPDYETFSEAIRVVGDFVDGKAQQLPEDICVGWTTQTGSRRSVLLRSLYADCRTRPQIGWDSSKIRHYNMLSDLDAVVKNRWRKDVVDRVYRNLSIWYSGSQPWAIAPEEPHINWSNNASGKWERAVAFIALRAMNLADIACNMENRNEQPEYLEEGLREFNAKGLAHFIALGVRDSGIDQTMRRALHFVLTPSPDSKFVFASVLEALQAQAVWPTEWPIEVRIAVATVLDRLLEDMQDIRPSLKCEYRPQWLREVDQG